MLAAAGEPAFVARKGEGEGDMDQEQFQSKMIDFMDETGKGISRLEESSKNQGAWLGKLDSRMNDFANNGCAVGTSNTDRIRGLESAGRKSVAAGIGGGTVMGGVVYGAIQLVQKLLGD